MNNDILKDMIIRPARPSDEDDIVELFIKTYAGEPWNEKWDRPDAYERVNDIFSNSKSYCIVCEFAGKIIGAMLCLALSWHKGKQLEIKEFVVDVNLQSKGIGSNMFLHCEQYVRSNNFHEIVLWTARNAALIRFYSRNGCSVDDDLICMSKLLDD